MNGKAFIKNVLGVFQSFMIFFTVIAFVITCTFLLSFNTVTLSEETVRTFAPVAFANIFILAALFSAIDYIRRKLTVDRPAEEILKSLNRIKNGDFSARIALSGGKYSHFSEIADNINLLAEELSGVEALRTDFISCVSHELKTPLAVMQNYGSLLREPKLSEEKRISYAESITEACKRLSELITNILKLNKLENQQIFPEKKKYLLNEQLCECILQYENLWEKKNIEPEIEINEDIFICSDPELLTLVWNNLLSNAFKFTDEGGRVRTEVYADESYAWVKISDTGCGISSEEGARIFDKFYQGDTSHSGQGNGLGLALVKRVVDIIHGEITVESEKGKGSTFTVKLRREHETDS